MIDTRCVVCGQAMADQAFACQHCGITRPTAQLQAIADMTPAARDVAHGVSKHSGGPGASGKPGSRLPLDLGATSKLDAVQASLGTQVRHVLAERGSAAQRVGTDPIIHAAWYLQAQLEWFRHRPEVDEFLRDVAAAARVVAAIARGPVEQKYLGPCGADTQIDVSVHDGEREWQMFEPGPPCTGDVYGPRGGQRGRCRTCGAEVAQADRAAWLDGEVRGHAFRAAHIADAYRLSVDTIRSWAARGQLVAHGSQLDVRTGKQAPLFNVGEVLDLAAADAARRAGEQAKRARRAASRAETEDAA